MSMFSKIFFFFAKMPKRKRTVNNKISHHLHEHMRSFRQFNMVRVARFEQELEKRRFAGTNIFNYAYDGWSNEILKLPQYKATIRNLLNCVFSAKIVWMQYFWILYGKVQESLCAEGGSGRLLDLRAFEAENQNK